MSPAANGLPTRFPCWCRAVYSWGGETKRDLGFVEGDLIECLNAGDGSWWTGRLRRDKRMVGLFPSNFVQVLDDSFNPASRATSPMPLRNGGGSISRAASPNPTAVAPPPQKTKSTFRKPFAAYAQSASPNPAAAARELEAKSRGPSPLPSNSLRRSHPNPSSAQNTPPYSRAPSPAPPTSYRPYSRGPSPGPGYSRAPSPAPPTHYRPYSHGPSPSPQYSRATSPAVANGYQNYSRAASPNPYLSRSPSPAPPSTYRPYSRGPSPSPYQDFGSSPPPPPPPPHRVALNTRAAPCSSHNNNPHAHNISRGPSPAAASPGLGLMGHTPPALRSAMDDVMSSLQDMEMSRLSPSPERSTAPLDTWSPEAFSQAHTKTSKRRDTRPCSSLGISGEGGTHHLEYDNGHDSNRPAPSRHDSTPPQLSNYVERMESRLRRTQQRSPRPQDELFLPGETNDNMGPPPAPPPKSASYEPRPQSAINRGGPVSGSTGSDRRLKNRKSAYELGKEVLGRTFTTKTSATSSSSGAQSTSTNATTSTSKTSQSIMSGYSAGGFSATSAGSLARKRGPNGLPQERPMSVMDARPNGFLGVSDGKSGFGSGRPETPLTGITYHSSNDSRPGTASQADWTGSAAESTGVFGGLSAPKAKKSGFFKKMIASAKTGAANARSSIAAGQSAPPQPPPKSMLPNGITAIAGGSAANDMGLGAAVDWVQVRRDVNRSNSLSNNERVERAERCQMMDHPAINPVDILYESAEGDEGMDGLAIEQPIDFQAVNLSLVDKNARFINSLPPMTNPTSLAQGYVCRPYRSDVQRLRAIFTWVSEKVAWEEDFEGEIDPRRAIQTRRGCAEEVAVLVMEMCAAVGLHAEVVRGYLKAPGEQLELDNVARPNHWWNTVIVDGEWRILDCALARPTNPRRGQYSHAGSQYAESWWFLTRPMEICYTHIPLLPEHQHICPPVHHEILMALPCACPPYFKTKLQMIDFDTSLLRIEKLELVQFQFACPEDIECVAEVEAKAYEQDADGDFFENGEVVRKRALAQAEWVNGEKRYTVKALLPGDEGHGVLKVYAGRRGLMHSIKDNPHPLAFALPIIHTGENPPYDFVTRHPTPHAQRHDLYVAQPQCQRLAVNNTFVFAVRQYPSSLATCSPTTTTNTNGATSPIPSLNPRPTSALSMSASSASGSGTGNPVVNGQTTTATPTHGAHKKHAKLAIQAPSGKILRLNRKGAGEGGGEMGGCCWETVIKIGERGVWRGLVLADRSARWCVFAEWNCV
ncbi:MAG: cytokinesis protein 3 [Candelina mexicana]|nr:MAG: cytokinesis protein 3 [Candelina mexicana]